MICAVCREGMASLWQPENPRKLGHIKEFPEVLRHQHPKLKEDDDVDEMLKRKKYWEPEKYVYGHHRDYDSVVRARAQGCVVCRQFTGTNDEDDVNITFAALGYYSVFVVEVSRSTQPEMTIYTGEDTEYIPSALVEHDHEDILNSAITGSTADAETWALVQGWLDACTEGHRTCSSHAAKGFAPTRLLELDGVGWEQTFRLVDSAQLTSPMEPYVTLSHCWGPGPVEEKLRLVHATEDMLRNGMPASRLPRLFRDALEIADRLGVRYIWIDRLCIIQDSAEDWATEAATMQTVYQNGFLNIAALGAKSDKDGCFFDRDPLVVAPTIINISPPGHEPLLFRFELEEDDGWRSTFEGEPLVSRAWVLQERVLAARTLYFGSKQVFWECHEANRCETDPARNLIKPAAPSIPHPPRCSDGKPVQSSWKMLIDPGRSSIGSWRSIVQSYSHCGLTFANDKLVAISGLAKDMSKKMKRQGWKSQPNAYLAGLWKDEMPASLLWHMESPAHRRPEYRAPSWSWASLDGIMGYGRGPHRDFFHANIVGARTVLRGEDAMGEVIGGSIVLSGPLCVLADGRAVRHFDDDREHHLFRTLNHPDTGLRLNVNYTRIRVDFDAREDHQEVVLLVICSDPNEQWGYLRAIGLALAPVQGIPSRFRRVGFVEFKVQAEEDEVIDCEKDLVNRIPNKSVEIV